MSNGSADDTATASGNVAASTGPVFFSSSDSFRDRFRPHFEEWVMGPINRLVSSDDALVSFVLMSCAIDYLSSFWYGESTQGKVGKVYPDFIETYFPGGRYDSGGLYDSLRNGLVHLFTIKGKRYILTHNRPDLHLKANKGGQIILNAGDFRDDLVLAKDKYFNEVEADPDLLAKLMKRFTRDGFLGPQDIPAKMDP